MAEANTERMPDTPSRKKDHVDLCVNENVAYESKATGLERWDFVHNALPELNADEVETQCEAFGRILSFPLMITGMTGGYPDAERINGQLAEVCNDTRIAIGAGSMRQAMENDRYHESWRVLRRKAPDVPVLANIGAVELARMKSADPARFLVDLIEADALVVHTNPLQEFVQPEGETRFRGVLDALNMVSAALHVPVVLKEVGAGISADVARRAYDAGVRWIDVSGAGGTSWAGVEMLRRSDGMEIAPAFREWGIPTAEALRAVASEKLADLRLIASGGITDGVQLAKCLALGADIGGAARPLLRALFDGGQDALRNRIESWRHDLRGVLFLVGETRPAALHTRIIQRT